MNDAGTDIEAELADRNLQGVWDRAKSWYNQASGQTLKPSQEDLATVTTERVDLYAAPTDRMLADYLTKSQPRAVFEKNREAVHGW